MEVRIKSFANPHSILFNPLSDIIDKKIILNYILNLDIDKQKSIYEFIRKEARQRNGVLALRAAREISQPIAHDELMRIAEVWVDAALKLEAKDLKMMERLVARQTGKAAATPGVALNVFSA